MNPRSKVDKYIGANPRRSWRLGLIILCLFFQLLLILVAWPLYHIIVQRLKIHWLIMVMFSLINLVMIYYFSDYNFSADHNTLIFFKKLFASNSDFIKALLQCDMTLAFETINQKCLLYIIALTPFILSLFTLIDLIKINPHSAVINALQRGQHSHDIPELNEKSMNSLLEDVKETNQKGVLLGISKYSGQPIFVTDALINQIVLVFGTTGGGKTVTLRRFNRYAIQQGYPLIIVDGKPNSKNIEYLQELAFKHNRPFMGFNCANFLSYDCLTGGGYTENKDKIICLKDNWDSEYY